MIRPLTAAAAVLLLAGCEMPVFDHPLSDEATSQRDDALIGHWEFIAPVEQAAEEGAEEPMEDVALPRWTFGRVADKPNVIEAVYLEIEDGVVQVRRIPWHSTQLGERRFASIRLGDKPDAYHLWLYRCDGQRLSIHFPGGEAVARAIERGDLAGEVIYEPPRPRQPPRRKSIRVTAEPAELARFLASHADDIFDRDAALQFRRIDAK